MESTYRYDADQRGWDLIPTKDLDHPEKDCLVVLEVTSGRRYGLWCTEDKAAEMRGSLRIAWDRNGPIGGSIEWGDVSLRTDAIVGIHTPPGVGTIPDEDLAARSTVRVP